MLFIGITLAAVKNLVCCNVTIHMPS